MPGFLSKERIVAPPGYGPVLVSYVRQYQLDRGTPAAQAYDVTLYHGPTASGRAP
jgi:hypothetical protein